MLMEKNNSNLFARAASEMHVGIKVSLSKNVVTLGKEVN